MGLSRCNYRDGRESFYSRYVDTETKHINATVLEAAAGCWTGLTPPSSACLHHPTDRDALFPFFTPPSLLLGLGGPPTLPRGREQPCRLVNMPTPVEKLSKPVMLFRMKPDLIRPLGD